MTHPYEQFRDGQIWQLLDRAVADLEANGDVTLSATRPYVLGYLCKQLVPLQFGDSRQQLAVWQWLCRQQWPSQFTDEQRADLAQDVVSIARAGSAEHVALFLADTQPMGGQAANTLVEATRIARAIVELLEESRDDDPGAGAF